MVWWVLSWHMYKVRSIFFLDFNIIPYNIISTRVSMVLRYYLNNTGQFFNRQQGLGIFFAQMFIAEAKSSLLCPVAALCRIPHRQNISWVLSFTLLSTTSLSLTVLLCCWNSSRDFWLYFLLSIHITYLTNMQCIVKFRTSLTSCFAIKNVSRTQIYSPIGTLPTTPK